jgi:hypothetical protein
MCKNATVSYNFNQMTGFKSTLYYICLIQTLQKPQFRYTEFSIEIQHGNKSAVTNVVMIKTYPQYANH